MGGHRWGWGPPGGFFHCGKAVCDPWDVENNAGLGHVVIINHAGDSSRDLFIPNRWRSRFQPLKKGHVSSPSPKKITSRIAKEPHFLRWEVLKLCVEDSASCSKRKNDSLVDFLGTFYFHQARKIDSSSVQCFTASPMCL